MRKDLLTLLGALVGVILLALAVVTVNSGQESSANTKELALETKAVAEATNREADALNNVATAEAIGGENELAAAFVAGDIELLRTFLPQGAACTTVRTITDTPSGDPGTPPTRTEVIDESCKPVIPSDQDVARAVERLTGTPVVPFPAQVCTGTGNDEVCTDTYTTEVHEQILPLDRLLPVVGGGPWQFLIPNGKTSIGGQWGPRDEPSGDRHVMTYTPSTDTLGWQAIGISGDVTVGDITNIHGGAGITVTGSDTHTPTVRITETLFDKINGIAPEAEVNVQSDWDETDSNDDAFILNKPGASHFLPAYQQSDEEFLSSRAGELSWEAIDEVPIAGAVGHTLTVWGDNDGDYRWEETHDATARAANSATQAEVNNNATSIEELTTGQTNLRRSVVNIVSLPTLPAEGSRDGKVAQFNDDVLEWSTVTGGSGATDATARQGVSDNAAAIAEHTTEITNLQGGFSTNHGLIVALDTDLEAVETDVAANRETIDRDATRLAVLHPDGTETELIWLSSETATSLFQIPAVITAANRDTPTASRLVVEGYIPGVSSVSDINTVVFSGQTIRTVSSLGEGEYIEDGLFKIIVGFTNTQAKNLVNSTSNPLRLQIFYGSGGLYNVDIPRRASGTALVPYIDPALIIGGVSSGGGTTDQTARDSAATAQAAAEAAASAAQTAQTKADTNATSIADIGVKLAAAVRVQNRGAGTDREYQSALDAQESANTPIILHVTAAITGTRDGATYTHPANSIFWVPPASDTVIHLFTLPNTTWRSLTCPRNICPILPTDTEFMVEIREPEGQRRYHNVFAIRAQLSTTAKDITVVVENPDGNADREAGATFTLNAAGTALTVALISATGNNPNYTITGVYAQ